MSIRRDPGKDIRPLGQAIRELLNTYHLDTRFDETNIVASWERVVGKPIARRTRRVWLRDKVLYAEFDSAAMKHDFLMHRKEILDLFQKEFGATAVSEIVVR
jgi:predicted nucleic acid-binding Zn ribbon protein